MDSQSDLIDQRKIDLFLLVHEEVWSLFGWRPGFAGRNEDGPVMVNEAGSDNYSLAGLVGFKMKVTGVGGQVLAEDDVTLHARATALVTDFVEKGLVWVSKEACGVKENGNEVVYTNLQKLAITETFVRNVTGGKAGKHLFIEQHCGDGKTGEWRQLASDKLGGEGEERRGEEHSKY